MSLVGVFQRRQAVRSIVSFSRPTNRSFFTADGSRVDSKGSTYTLKYTLRDLESEGLSDLLPGDSGPLDVCVCNNVFACLHAVFAAIRQLCRPGGSRFTAFRSCSSAPSLSSALNSLGICLPIACKPRLVHFCVYATWGT